MKAGRGVGFGVKEGDAWRVQVGLCFGTALVLYVERVAFALVLTQDAHTHGLAADSRAKGAVLSAFFYGYALTQIPAGWAAPTLGGASALGAGCLASVVPTALCALATSRASGPAFLWAARFLAGCVQGVCFPSIHTVLAANVPAARRAGAASYSTSGMYLGSALGMLLLPPLWQRSGSAVCYLAVATLCAASGAAWVTAGDDGPLAAAGHQQQQQKQQQGLLPGPGPPLGSGGGGGAGATPWRIGKGTPWRAMLGSSAVWTVVASNFAFHYTFFVILNWLPTYYTAQGVDLGTAAGTVPYLVMFALCNVGGWASDWLVAAGPSVLAVRKGMNTLGFAVCCAALLSVSTAGRRGAASATAVVACAAGGAAISRAGFAVNHLDIAPSHAGLVLSLANTAGTLGGAIGVTATGWVLHSTGGDWDAVFALPIAINAVAAVLFLLFAQATDLFPFSPSLDDDL